VGFQSIELGLAQVDRQAHETALAALAIGTHASMERVSAGMKQVTHR
jgi:hypothetical protein